MFSFSKGLFKLSRCAKSAMWICACSFLLAAGNKLLVAESMDDMRKLDMLIAQADIINNKKNFALVTLDIELKGIAVILKKSRIQSHRAILINFVKIIQE
ncbi:MAG: hypothetical protein NTX50_24930 [Candidatus Sumerlaeota bacterium]|nr:hypothetical protein [Candidatus Sumerlaeota bacterium]